ncbi:Mitotic spindle checkpoint protein MAD1 [Glycine max]|nr:Mitotic spindle checkpoint protein MAD1 [Glycine max]
MSQEVASTESNVLVKHLQQELRNYPFSMQMTHSVLDVKKRYCFSALHLSRHLLSFDLDIFYQCREVIYGTQKEGEITTRLKQMEVALDAAEIGKQNAEAEAELAKDKAEVLKSEIKGIELMGHSNNDGQTKDPSLIDDVANNDGHQTTDVDWSNSTTFIPSPTWTSSKSTMVDRIACR